MRHLSTTKKLIKKNLILDLKNKIYINKNIKGGSATLRAKQFIYLFFLDMALGGGRSHPQPQLG
jgi:hypothetical protein